MARDRRANIGTGIWSETSMRRLTRRQRDAYMLVYTQPDLTRCGVLPYRLRYWSTLAVDSTEAELAEDFHDLDASRHVILDESDEQLFIRTYVKHDGLLSQPLVVASMIRDYHRITSPLVRVEFLAELRRLWDDADLEPKEHRGLELVIGANPADLGIKDAPKVASAIGAGLLGKMIEAIGDGQVEPFPAKGLPKGLTEGQRQGLTEGLPGGQREGLPDPRACATAPATAPAPAPAPAPAAIRDDPPEPIDDASSALLREHAAAYPTPPPPSALVPVRREICRLLAEHTHPDQIRDGLAKMREKNLGATLLPQLVVEATNARHRPSTTDARVAAGLDLAARYEQAGE